MFSDQYRRAAEPPDAAQTIKEANWWLQHYRRTGDPRALQCALAYHDAALERQHTANLWRTSSEHDRNGPVFAKDLAAAAESFPTRDAEKHSPASIPEAPTTSG